MMDLIPYQQIEYLESSDIQYIDTGIKGNTEYKYIFDYKVEVVGSGPIFGMRNKSSFNQDSIFCFSFRDSANAANFYINKGPGANSTYNTFINKKDAKRHSVIIDINKSELTMDGISASNIKFPTEPFITDYNLFIFGNNVAGVNNGACVRFYEYLVMNGDTKIQHLIPVRVGNVGYMYDLVSKQLFGNAGTGDFILGPDKVY